MEMLTKSRKHVAWIWDKLYIYFFQLIDHKQDLYLLSGNFLVKRGHFMRLDVFILMIVLNKSDSNNQLPKC